MRPMRFDHYPMRPQRRGILPIAAVIWALLFINLFVFVGSLLLGEKGKAALWYLLGLKSPAVNRTAFEGGDFFQLIEPISYAFLHGDWAHLLSNMLFLVIFGQIVALRFGGAVGYDFAQRLWGSIVFLLFYLSAACFCGLVFLLMSMGEARTLIGASGAISALMGAAICVAMRRFQPFGLFHGKPMTILEPKILIMTGAYIAVNLWQGVHLWQYGSSIEAGRVSWESHVAGFLYGVFFLPYFDRLIIRHK